MNPMMYASFDLQPWQLERNLSRGRAFVESGSVRDRLGRALILLGSQLVTEPDSTAGDELRRAA